VLSVSLHIAPKPPPDTGDDKANKFCRHIGEDGDLVSTEKLLASYVMTVYKLCYLCSPEMSTSLLYAVRQR
jgi:hypothetical protein